MQIGKSVALLDANSTSIFPYTSANSIFYITEIPSKGSDGSTEFSGTPLNPVTSSIIAEISDNSSPSFIQSSSKNLNQWSDDIGNENVVTGIKVFPLTEDISVGANTIPKNQNIGIIGYKSVSGTSFLKNAVKDSSTVKQIANEAEDKLTLAAAGLSDKTNGTDGSAGVFFKSPYSLEFTGDLTSNNPIHKNGRRVINFTGAVGVPGIENPAKTSIDDHLNRLTVDFYASSGNSSTRNYIAYTKDIEHVDASIKNIKTSITAINSSITGINDTLSTVVYKTIPALNASVQGNANSIGILETWQDEQDASIRALRTDLDGISGVNDLYVTTDDSNMMLFVTQPYTASTGTLIMGSDSEAIPLNLTDNTALIKYRLNPTLTIKNINCSEDISVRSIRCSSTFTATNIFGTSVTIDDLSVKNTANINKADINDLSVGSLTVKNGDNNKVITGTGSAYPIKIINSTYNSGALFNHNASDNALQADISKVLPPSRESKIWTSASNFTYLGSTSTKLHTYFSVNGAGIAHLHIKIKWGEKYNCDDSARNWHNIDWNFTGGWDAIMRNYKPIEPVENISITTNNDKIILSGPILLSHYGPECRTNSDGTYGVTLALNVSTGQLAFAKDAYTGRLGTVDGYMHFYYNWIY